MTGFAVLLRGTTWRVSQTRSTPPTPITADTPSRRGRWALLLNRTLTVCSKKGGRLNAAGGGAFSVATHGPLGSGGVARHRRGRRRWRISSLAGVLSPCCPEGNISIKLSAAVD